MSDSFNYSASTYILFLIRLIIIVTAIVIAWQCNKPSAGRYLKVVASALFPEIYLIQYAVRKYMLHEPYECYAVGH